MAEIWGLAVAGVAAAGIGAYGAMSAADTQAGAAENAQNISEGQFNTINSQEQPFLQSGQAANQELGVLLGTSGNPTTTTAGGGGYGSLVTPFTSSYMQQYSPAYQFQMQQGQNGVLNADSSSQGALSGAALKDLTSYNQNYANTAYNTAATQYQNQQSSIYSRLAGIANLGQNAASQTAQSGTALAGQAAQSATNVGTAQAAGTVGAANALSSGASNLGSIYAAYGAGGTPATTPNNFGVTGSDW